LETAVLAIIGARRCEDTRIGFPSVFQHVKAVFPIAPLFFMLPDWNASRLELTVAVNKDSLRNCPSHEVGALTFFMSEGYCVKCKAKKPIADGVEETMKNGRKAIKGKCPTCGTVMFKILGKSAAAAPSPAPAPNNPPPQV